MANNTRPPRQAIVRESVEQSTDQREVFHKTSIELHSEVNSDTFGARDERRPLAVACTPTRAHRSLAHLENASWHICAYGLTDPYHADLSHSAIASIMAWNSGFASSSRFVPPELSDTSKGSLRTRLT